MKCLTLISVVIIGLLSMNSATAEGDDAGNVPRPRVGGVVAPGVIAPGALRAVTSVTHLGPISCPASDTSADGRTVCSNAAAYAFNSDAPDIVYALKVQAPAAHCAPVVYSVIVGNRTSVLSSRALNGSPGKGIRQTACRLFSSDQTTHEGLGAAGAPREARSPFSTSGGILSLSSRTPISLPEISPDGSGSSINARSTSSQTMCM